MVQGNPKNQRSECGFKWGWSGLPHGRILRVLGFSIVDGKIAAVEVIGNQHRLADVDLVVLEP